MAKKKLKQDQGELNYRQSMRLARTRRDFGLAINYRLDQKRANKAISAHNLETSKRLAGSVESAGMTAVPGRSISLPAAIRGLGAKKKKV